MENVPGAPLENPLTLCGTEFNLVADRRRRPTSLHLKRHRLFESNVFIYRQRRLPVREYKRRGIGVGGAYGGGSVDRAHAKDVRRGGYTPSSQSARRCWASTG
jgi:DNA (cytosine-5)-methyltransferase 1